MEKSYGDVIERYRLLPESRRVPDSVWAVQKLLLDIDLHFTKIEKLKKEMKELAVPAMMANLKENWSENELKDVGLIT